MPVPRRFLARLLSIALLLTLAACGGGGDEPATPPPPAATTVAAGQAAQQNVGAAGGSVSLATHEGATFMLEVPAGAVGAGTPVSITSAAVATGQRFHLRLAPAGLVLADGLEATLTITLPTTMALPTGALLVYDGVPLPYTRQADGRITLRLARFAGTPAAAGSAAPERARALAARPLADTPAACAGVPGTADGGLSGGDPIEADLYGQCMVDTVNRLAASGEFADAVRVASAVGAYLQSIGAANTDQLAGRFADQARSLTCTQYGRVLDNAANGRIENMGSLHQLVRPVLFWEATRQRLGAQCPGIGNTWHVTVIEALTDAAIRFYASKQGAIVDANGVEYTEAVREARSGNDTVSQVRALQAPQPLQQLARTQTEQRAQPALLEAMLQAPWQRCRDSGNFDKLIELMQLLRQPASVKAAAQYCATQLQARAMGANGQATATLQPALGGVRAGELRASGTINVARDGRLELTGPIHALQCPSGQAGGSESLQIKLGSTVLQTLTAAPYLATALQIDIAQALQAAGIDAADFRNGTLTLVRSGSPCGGHWGSNPEPLLTLELTSGLCVPPAGRSHCVTVLADLNSSDRDFHAATAISNRGAHVLVTGIQGGSSKPSIWHNGRATPLPDDFWAYGGTEGAATSVADDGSVAGWAVTLSADGQSITSFTPAAFSPTGNRLTKFMSTAFVAREPMPQTHWPNYGLTRDLTSMSISPQGRITFTITESGNGNGWSGSDLGWCGQHSLNFGLTGYDCYRYIRYEAPSPGDTATEQQRLHPTSTGDLHYTLFDGGSGVGRVGTAGELITVGSSQGGIGGWRTSGEKYQAREHNTSTPRTYGRHYGADRFGRTVTSTASGTQLLPSSAAVPSGWSVGSLGLEGHLQVCNSDGTTTRLIDLNSGQTLLEVNTGTTLIHQGQSLELSAGCSAQARVVDALGRMLGQGWVSSASREVPVIYTPAGVALP